MDDDKRAIVCANIGSKNLYLIPGSQLLTCDLCEQGMWISPSGYSYIKEHPEVDKICESCAAKMAGSWEEVLKIGKPIGTPEQVEEFKEALKQLRGEK